MLLKSKEDQFLHTRQHESSLAGHAVLESFQETIKQITSANLRDAAGMTMLPEEISVYTPDSTGQLPDPGLCDPRGI